MLRLAVTIGAVKFTSESLNISNLDLQWFPLNTGTLPSNTTREELLKTPNRINISFDIYEKEVQKLFPISSELYNWATYDRFVTNITVKMADAEFNYSIDVSGLPNEHAPRMGIRRNQRGRYTIVIFTDPRFTTTEISMQPCGGYQPVKTFDSTGIALSRHLKNISALKERYRRSGAHDFWTHEVLNPGIGGKIFMEKLLIKQAYTPYDLPWNMLVKAFGVPATLEIIPETNE